MAAFALLLSMVSIMYSAATQDIIISISPAQIPPGTVGQAYSVWSVAYPDGPTYYWKLSDLPPGITYRVVNSYLNIYGTPTNAGNYVISGKVSNGYGTANFTYYLPVRYSKDVQDTASASPSSSALKTAPKKTVVSTAISKVLGTLTRKK